MSLRRRMGWMTVVMFLLSSYLPSAVQADPSLTHMRVPFIGRYDLSEACLNTSTNPYHRNGAGYAIDAPMASGVPIYSPVTGNLVQEQSGWVNGYGNTVLIQDQQGLYTRLAHMAFVYKRSGSVQQGELIGLSSNTGGTIINGKEMSPHLHWHVQSGVNQGISSPINLDAVDRVTVSNCNSSTVGYAEGLDISSNPSGWCDTFRANNWSQVTLFDHKWCKGNYRALESSGFGRIMFSNSLDSGFDNRARSIYVPPGKSVLVSDNAANPGERFRCITQDAWNLDVDTYKTYNANNQLIDTGVKIGWGGGDGQNMISWVTTFENNNCTLGGEPFGLRLVKASRTGFDFVAGGIGMMLSIESQKPSLLTTFATADKLPFDVEFHVVVANTTGSDYFDSTQICVGTVCNESQSLDWRWNWNTYGHDDGTYDVKVRYRTALDGGNWANAEVIYDGELFLSPARGSYAPCSSNATGVKLTSGSDCIVVTKDTGNLAPVGWDGRANVQACMVGSGTAWLYDDPVDEIGNNLGMAYVVENTQCQNVGSSISSVNLRDQADAAPPPPSGPFAADSDTVHLWHMNDSHADYIANGDTIADSAGSMSGTVTVGQWVGGVFESNGLGFFSSSPGRGLTFGSMDVCPITFEGWIHFLNLNSSGDGRIAGQLGGGGNSGPNKWLLSTDDYKPKFEIWSSTGSKFTTSFQEITDTEWHYVMAAYDCSTREGKLYLDNELVGSFVSPSVWNSGATTLEVGTSEGVFRCNCEVDEIRISATVRKPVWPPAPVEELENAKELLTQPVRLEGNNGDDEAVIALNGNALNGRDTVRVTLDLHGLTPLGGDASALAFEQSNQWQYVGMAAYLVPGANGLQTFDIPLDDFMSLNPDVSVGPMHIRFWYGSAFTVDVTRVVAYSAASSPPSGVELLSQPLHLSGNNGSDEEVITVGPNVLNGKTMARVTLDLNGLTALGGDASALAFEQGNQWQYVGLAGYVNNGLDGSQTVEIPLADLMDLDPNQPVGSMHIRFWYGSAFNVDITSVFVH